MMGNRKQKRKVEGEPNTCPTGSSNEPKSIHQIKHEVRPHKKQKFGSPNNTEPSKVQSHEEGKSVKSSKGSSKGPSKGGGKPLSSANTDPTKVGSNWEKLKQTIGAGKKNTWREKQTKDSKGSKGPEIGGDAKLKDQSLTKVVALDCEMVGVGPNGRKSALARVTIVNSFGNVIYDTHVAVKERVTDLRTHVSGIRAWDLKGAPDFEQVQAKVTAILKGRVLVGHTLKSDMTALQLSHPPRDTRDLALYWPFCRSTRDDSEGGPTSKKLGRPKGLKVLAAEVLGMEIQTGEHSPVEDARASLYIYLRYRKQWERDMHTNKTSL